MRTINSKKVQVCNIAVLEQGVFANKKITTIELPDTLVGIGKGALQNKMIKEIRLNEGLKAIGLYVYNNFFELKHH